MKYKKKKTCPACKQKHVKGKICSSCYKKSKTKTCRHCGKHCTGRICRYCYSKNRKHNRMKKIN